MFEACFFCSNSFYLFRSVFQLVTGVATLCWICSNILITKLFVCVNLVRFYSVCFHQISASIQIKSIKTKLKNVKYHIIAVKNC